MNRTYLKIFGGVVLLALMPASASARTHVNINLGIGTPYYAEPPPVYYEPRYYSPPPPVYYGPSVIYQDDYYDRRDHDRGRHRGHWHHHD